LPAKRTPESHVALAPKEKTQLVFTGCAGEALEDDGDTITAADNGESSVAGEDDLEDADEDAPSTEWVTSQITMSVAIQAIDAVHVAPPPPSFVVPPVVETAMIHNGQKREAEGFMAKIVAAIEKSGKSLDFYDRFELLIQNPNLNSLYNQNVSRLKSFILHYQKEMNPRFFQKHMSPTYNGDCESEQLMANIEGLVNTNHKSSKPESKCNKLREEWIGKIKRNPRTLFLVVHDEAHYEATKDGGADKFVNHDVVRTSTNVVTLFVSATPYNLLTADSQIPECNIHAWQYDERDDESSVQVDSDMKYFGLK
jgi:hypothetical protein